MVWILCALALTGVLLSTLFRENVEESLDQQINVVVESLIAVADLAPDGGIALSRPLQEPRFDEPFSGWYWQIMRGDAPLLRSRSLWDEALAIEIPEESEGPEFGSVPGPDQADLRYVLREAALPGSPERYRFVVAVDSREIRRDVRIFASTLVWSLGALGAGLIAAVLLQVGYGLKPLRRLQDALGAVRRGRSRRLSGTFPAEITPLVREVNALLDENTAVIERTRTHVGNLAHALKTPLSVLSNEAVKAEGPLADLVREQTAAMNRQISHHLARARAAGGADVLGARTELFPVLEQLRRTLARLHAGRPIELAVEGERHLSFRGEQRDLEEILGNVLDNAFKWAQRRIRVRAGAEGAMLRIEVEDDGPGVPEGGDFIARGKRLDETVKGSGLGLAITRDIVALYGGSLELARAALGGLKVAILLPRAE